MGGFAAIQHHGALFELEPIAGQSRGDQLLISRCSAPQTVLLMGLSLADCGLQPAVPWGVGLGS